MVRQKTQGYKFDSDSEQQQIVEKEGEQEVILDIIENEQYGELKQTYLEILENQCKPIIPHLKLLNSSYCQQTGSSRQWALIFCTTRQLDAFINIFDQLQVNACKNLEMKEIIQVGPQIILLRVKTILAYKLNFDFFESYGILCLQLDTTLDETQKLIKNQDFQIPQQQQQQCQYMSPKLQKKIQLGKLKLQEVKFELIKQQLQLTTFDLLERQSRKQQENDDSLIHTQIKNHIKEFRDDKSLKLYVLKNNFEDMYLKYKQEYLDLLQMYV